VRALVFAVAGLGLATPHVSSGAEPAAPAAQPAAPAVEALPAAPDAGATATPAAPIESTSPAAGAIAAATPAPPGCRASSRELVAAGIEELVAKRRGRVKIDTKAPCLLVGDLALPAGLFELPAWEGPYSIRIESLVRGTYVLPRIDMLDGEHRVLRTLEHDDFTRRGASVSTQMFLNDANANERYLLIYPDPSQLGRQETQTRGGTGAAYTGFGMLFYGTDQTTTVQAVERGELVFTLIGERWEKKQPRR
jgi:hypothetical protein